MKLLYCPTCHDVRKLGYTWTSCQCGEVRGRYVDNINAEWNGKGSLLGFANSSLTQALLNRDLPLPGGLGHRFEAFTIPVTAPTVTIVKEGHANPKAMWPFPTVRKGEYPDGDS